MGEDYEDPSPCCIEMNTFLQEGEGSKKLTINKVEYSVSKIISRGNIDKPMHMVLQKVRKQKIMNYFSMLKPWKEKYYSARLYPASMSSVADYEADITAKLKQRTLFPISVARESYKCFTVLLTDRIGEDLEKRDGNQWRSDPVKGNTIYPHLMRAMVDALEALYAKKIMHNNISPSSVSCVDCEKDRAFRLTDFRKDAVPDRLFSPWTNCAINITMTDEWYAGLTLLTIALYGETERVQCKGKTIDPCKKGDTFFDDQQAILESKFPEEKIHAYRYLKSYMYDVKLLMCMSDQKAVIEFLSVRHGGIIPM